MIEIDNKIVSFDVFQQKFCCDVSKCKGACCVEGDLGAGLTEEEIKKIKEILPLIKSFLTEEANKIITERGFCELEFGDEYTTNLCKNGMCIFANIDENNIYYCIFEKAFNLGIINFLKPISCHLYPIRIKKYDTMETVNYDEWQICKDAIEKGKELNISVLDFLEKPLIRKYGRQWFDEAQCAKEYFK